MKINEKNKKQPNRRKFIEQLPCAGTQNQRTHKNKLCFSYMMYQNRNILTRLTWSVATFATATFFCVTHRTQLFTFYVLTRKLLAL